MTGTLDWRRAFGRTIASLLALKLIALLLMKVFLFSPEHAPDVGAAVMSRRLGLEATPDLPSGAAHD